MTCSTESRVYTTRAVYCTGRNHLDTGGKCVCGSLAVVDPPEREALV